MKEDRSRDTPCKICGGKKRWARHHYSGAYCKGGKGKGNDAAAKGGPGGDKGNGGKPEKKRRADIYGTVPPLGKR